MISETPGYDSASRNALSVCERVGAHRDLGDVDVAVVDGDHAQVLLADRLALRGELGHGAAGGRLRRLAAGVRVDLGVEHQDVHVAARGEHVVEPAEADVVGPAVAADDPDAPADQGVGHVPAGPSPRACRRRRRLCFRAATRSRWLADLRPRRAARPRGSPDQVVAERRGEAAGAGPGRSPPAGRPPAGSQAELGVVLEQRVRPGRAAAVGVLSRRASSAGCRRRSTSSRWRWRSARGRRRAGSAA